ncbi:hypothetical protein ACVGVM_17350 [Pseudonocardia bannensis]|uniref:Uncharacterized protein n=1 Tax=Pseudonocardia bannensis TaxID=630973 RepID=A0A848DJN1_9PSEU|nr:hypothetical protein [Pseudonocardia bannensis]NMH92775.1 hypothetical protein [Pseudonocardia bannensis]
MADPEKPARDPARPAPADHDPPPGPAMADPVPPADETGQAGPRPPDDEPRFSWQGAPGYTPLPETLPPHAPMPGAPPYPAQPEHPPAPVGQAPARTGYARALGATAVWAAVNLALVLLVAGPPPAAESAGVFTGRLVLPMLVGALLTWLIARRRRWPFRLLVVVAAPLFWVLRALANLV